MSAEQWTVHVNGPDDIVDVENYDEAVILANDINATVQAGLATRTEFHPFVWAIPVRKGYYSYPMKPGDSL